MNANRIGNGPPTQDDFSAEEETMTVREMVARVRRMPAEQVKALAETLVAAQTSDEEAEEAVKTIDEIFNPPRGHLVPMVTSRARS